MRSPTPRSLGLPLSLFLANSAVFGALLTGHFADSRCPRSFGATHAACARHCVSMGEEYIFITGQQNQYQLGVSKGSINIIDAFIGRVAKTEKHPVGMMKNQDFGKVIVEGSLKGDELTVRKIWTEAEYKKHEERVLKKKNRSKKAIE